MADEKESAEEVWDGFEMPPIDSAGYQEAVRWVLTNPKTPTTDRVREKIQRKLSARGRKELLAELRAIPPRPPEAISPVWDGKGECPCCKRGPEEVLEEEECERLAREWLREHGAKA